MNGKNSIEVSTELRQAISTEQAWHYHIVPKSNSTERIEFFIDESLYQNGIEQELEIILGKTVGLEPINKEELENALNKYYIKGAAHNNEALRVSGTDSKDFVLDLIKEAKGLGGSDIHFEAFENECRVRLRVDGDLIERYIIHKSEYPSLINKIKIMAHLDIAEKRLPQDGRIFYKAGGVKLDIRVSSLPTLHGEKIVLRLLGNDATDIDINSLGFSDLELTQYLEVIKKPKGIILISGPTGSGKTTTLYATLKLLNKTTKNILTIEDPIEYTLKGINQVQLRPDIGLGFSEALRTFLRQDPNIIMLGEIRDEETANMAVRFALTGHLVLSTIHTNSAWGTISRLEDMGVPNFLLADTLNATIAQRLVRKLCPHCKEKAEFDKSLFPPGFDFPEPLEHHYVAKGCNQCFFTGYRGRKAVYEVVPIDRELAGYIKKGETDVDEVYKEKQVKQIKHNVFELIKSGDTSIEEAYPVLLG